MTMATARKLSATQFDALDWLGYAHDVGMRVCADTDAGTNDYSARTWESLARRGLVEIAPVSRDVTPMLAGRELLRVLRAAERCTCVLGARPE